MDKVVPDVRNSSCLSLSPPLAATAGQGSNFEGADAPRRSLRLP